MIATDNVQKSYGKRAPASLPVFAAGSKSIGGIHPTAIELGSYKTGVDIQWILEYSGRRVSNRGRDHLNGFGLVEAAQHRSEVSDGEGVDDEHFLGARRMHDFIERETSRVPQRLAARRRPHSE